MSENIKVEALDVEEKSIAEKEAEVQKLSTNEDGDYTVDLGKINKQKEETDAVQEQKTEDGVLRGSRYSILIGKFFLSNNWFAKPKVFYRMWVYFSIFKFI